MKITFLGTGTSQGVPMIGCDCAVCRSTDSRDHRFRCSVYVEGPTGRFLIDSTPDLRMQCIRAGIKEVNAVVYTHGHADHMLGMDDCRQFNAANGGKLPLYGSASTLEILKRVFFYLFTGEVQPGYVNPDPHVIEGTFELAGLNLTPLPVKHAWVETWGYLLCEGGVRKMAYIADCKEIPESTKALIREVPLLVLDGLRFREHPTHLTLPQAVELAVELRVGKAYFTHLTHDISHARVEPTLPENMRLAYDTLVLDL